MNKNMFGEDEDSGTLNSKPNSPEEGGGDDDMFNDGMDDDLFGVPDPEDDDENEISITKIKAEVGFIDDEYVGVNRAKNGKKEEEDENEDDRSSVVSHNSIQSVKTPQPVTINPFSEPQEPFQPNETPKHLDHRFMVWNNIGTIRSYGNDNDDPAIDVEFHDPSHHGAVHLRNQFEYTIGTLSSEAIILACEKGNDVPSKLFCLNYGSWDSTKEWTCDMPEGEDVLAIAIGVNWVIAATSLNRLRLFSLGGVQHLIYDFPGRVVAASGFNDLLFVTYHYGLAVQGSQSIFFSVLRVKGHSLKPLILHSPLPLSTESTLSWIGFTDEGTPAFSDSSNTLRILSGQLWTPFCNMKEFLSGQNDHFWVVGLSQLEQHIRAVKCRGIKYPPTIPRPTQMILDAKIPLCQLETEKGQMEEVVLRSLMSQNITKKMERKGFDLEDYKTKFMTDVAENLIKLFELSIRGNRDFRGMDYVSLLPSTNGIKSAVKLASRYKKNALEERLRTIAQNKMESPASESEDDDFETQSFSKMSESRCFAGFTSTTESPHSFDTSTIGNAQERNHTLTELGVENPLLEQQKDEIRKIINPEIRKPNPFKKSEEELKKNEPQVKISQKNIPVIDAWKKLSDKPVELEFNPKYPKPKQTGQKRGRKSDKESKETTAKGKKVKI